MKRRNFLTTLLGFAGSSIVPTSYARTQPKSESLLIQHSELAGFQYYEGKRLFHELKIGDKLTLKREAENPFDKRAVEVYWQGHMLGHIPRNQNAAISQMIDRKETLTANITQLSDEQNPWQKIKLAIYWNENPNNTVISNRV